MLALETRSAPSGGHLGDGLPHAAPYLLGAWLSWLLVPACFVVCILAAFFAMRTPGARSLGRLALAVLLVSMVGLYAAVRRDNEDVGAASTKRSSGPTEAECALRANAGAPCPAPDGAALKRYTPPRR